jgi:UDP-glucose 4-epimerase
MQPRDFYITGGAGFIGSSTAAALLVRPGTRRVTVIDNFSSGREWHLAECAKDSRFRLVRGDLHDLPLVLDTMAGHDTVFHFASNPDIAKAATDPDIDFRQGTELTRNVVEAARRCAVERILYTSGSGVYGDLGETLMSEDHGPLVPVSTYAASKIAGEGLVCAYSHMFGIQSRVFRFANVIGSHQTHGVGYDFMLRLHADPTRLRILGDGTQSKSYIHVDDVVAAMLLSMERAEGPSQVFNVGTGDYITVDEIAVLAAEVAGLDRAKVAFERTGGSMQAMRDAMTGMLDQIRRGRIA